MINYVVTTYNKQIMPIKQWMRPSMGKGDKLAFVNSVDSDQPVHVLPTQVCKKLL